MTPKRILVHMERDREWSPHLEVAIAVARQFDAHIHALIGFVEAAILRSYFHDGNEMLKDERQRSYEILEERRARLKKEGDKYGIQTSIEGIEWDTAGAMSLAGRFFDLIVVGKTEPYSEDSEQDISGECLRGSGRPVIIVPKQGSFPTIGKRILIAWNGSREAAHALQAADPFLQNAEKIILAISKMPTKFEKVKSLQCLDIEGLLRDHYTHFDVAPKRIPDATAAQDIIDLAKENDCDLIVMGSFGRSWLRDWVLGSTTSATQNSSHIPILTHR